MLGELSLQQKLALTTWLCDQRRLGVEAPTIDDNNLQEIISRQRLLFTQRVERTLLFLAADIKRIDEVFPLRRGDDPQNDPQRVSLDAEPQ